MCVVVKTLVGFEVMFEHGESFVHRSDVVAARGLGDVV